MIIVLKKGASKKEMQTLTKKLKKSEGVDTKKYCGVISLKEEPLAIQKQMRDEWR